MTLATKYPFSGRRAREWRVAFLALRFVANSYSTSHPRGTFPLLRIGLIHVTIRTPNHGTTNGRLSRIFLGFF